ncbi:MAG: hypothetical protein FWE33_05675 [Defluviitaleaceae bacterium]|nr:hypothetical protein [Defluviitaleaceae bacterium]
MSNIPPPNNQSPPPPHQAPPPYGAPIPPYAVPVVPYKQPGDGKATGSLVLGIISVVCCGSLPFGLIGLILALSAKKDGFTGGKMTAGLVLSIIGLVFFVGWIIYYVFFFLIWGLAFTDAFWYDLMYYW